MTSFRSIETLSGPYSVGNHRAVFWRWIDYEPVQIECIICGSTWGENDEPPTNCEKAVADD